MTRREDIESVIIKPRMNAQGRPYTEIFIVFWRGDQKLQALTRWWDRIMDTPQQREFEAQAFLRRQRQELV